MALGTEHVLFFLGRRANSVIRSNMWIVHHLNQNDQFAVIQSSSILGVTRTYVLFSSCSQWLANCTSAFTPMSSG